MERAFEMKLMENGIYLLNGATWNAKINDNS